MPSVDEIRKVIDAWLFEGKSTRQIEESTGVKKTTAHEIIADFRKTTPNVNLFRELWMKVPPPRLSRVDQIRAMVVLAKIADLDISVFTIEKAIKIVNTQGENADAAVSAALLLDERAKKSGKGVQEIVEEEKILRDNIEALTAEKTKCTSQITQLKQQIPNLLALTELQK